MEAQPPTSPRRDSLLLSLSIFIVSLSVLMFEIALTRIFSVMLSYHYVFIAVSVALLGLGIGAVFFRHVRARMPPAEGSFGALCKLSLVFAISIPLSLLLALKIPHTDFLAAYYTITFVPFFFAGMIFALVFDRFAEHSGKLYCASLVGSGVGPLVILFTLESLGGVNTAMLVSSISMVSAIALALGSKGKRLIAPSLIGFLLLSVLFVANIELNYIGEVKSDPHKELFAFLNHPDLGARVSKTYWSAYARTDLVEMGNYPDVKIIFNDGGAGMAMYRFDGDLESVEFLKNTSAFFPFYFGDRDDVLIIGAGGGKDVLIALLGGAKRIDAVEINPDIVRIVREESEFNGGIYHHENVSWIVDEGRSFVKRSNDEYDVIMFMLVYTKSAREVVGYSLSESYIFTVEAFHDYLDILTENGRLVIVAHDNQEITRLFAIAVKALNERGKTTIEATRHMISLMDAEHMPALILRKSPFSENEIAELHAAAHYLGFGPIYFPYFHEGQPFNQLSGGQISLEAWISAMPFDASPATDDSPFFYKQEKGLPSSLSSLLYGVAFLTALVILAALSSLHNRIRFIGAKNPKMPPPSLSLLNFVPYFALLGVGFMLVEIALVQRFILFLGRPTLTFSVLLFSLLLGGGVGSLFTERFREKLPRKMALACALVGLLVAGYAVTLPFLFDMFLGHGIMSRLLMSIMVLLPLGFLMGMPFPVGLRAVKRSFERDIAWMWGINGVASVLGSALAVALAILSGFTLALALGAIFYLCAGFLSKTISGVEHP